MPTGHRAASIERTSEYDAFMEDLSQYHAQRGTHLDNEPKIANRRIDLYKLYQKVTQAGGYDVISDTKINPLAWRRLAAEFLPPSAHVATHAFHMKTAYYKNLAAYEISRFHHREPPPREILENVSARGGDLLNRTLENFSPKALHDLESEVRKPHADTQTDDTLSASRRSTRSLRQAPPQRIVFRPDTSIPRHSRSSNGGITPSSLPMSSENISDTPTSLCTRVDQPSKGPSMPNFEPKVPVACSVVPVITPGNKMTVELLEGRDKMLPVRGSNTTIPTFNGMMMPGTGFQGPNIYIRAQLALQSGIEEEMHYALHHLVKISHERGDKYRFDAFPGLAESLIQVVLSISELFYEIRWRVKYSKEQVELNRVNTLNGLSGTTDLLDRIDQIRKKERRRDTLETIEFTRRMLAVNEAALVLRNMMMLEENVTYAACMPLLADMLVIVLNIEQVESTTEVRHYALDMVEQLSKFYTFKEQEALYTTLIRLIENGNEDRGEIIVSLRSLGRAGIGVDATVKLKRVSAELICRICDWLLVDDEELRAACLDLLYIYTASWENVAFLIKLEQVDTLIGQCVRLLMYGATFIDATRKVTVCNEGTENPPRIPAEVAEQLYNIENARDQSIQWLRVCYEEDATFEVTQINLWNAYNSTFAGQIQGKSGRALMNAKDFISNVSQTFPGASAQFSQGNPPKYTIKGIRPRKRAVDLQGRENVECLWQPVNPTGKSYNCEYMKIGAREVWEHILKDHLGLGDSISQPIEGESKSTVFYDCQWKGCGYFTRTQGRPTQNVEALARHILTHLPDTDSETGRSEANKRKVNTVNNAKLIVHDASRVYLNTATDEKDDAVGLPLVAVLILRNIARQIGTISTRKEDKETFNMFSRSEERDGSVSPVSSLQSSPTDEKLSFKSANLKLSGCDVKRSAMGKSNDDAIHDEKEEIDEGSIGEQKKVTEDKAATELTAATLFAKYHDDLYYVMTYNLALREYVTSLIRTIASGAPGGVW